MRLRDLDNVRVVLIGDLLKLPADRNLSTSTSVIPIATIFRPDNPSQGISRLVSQPALDLQVDHILNRYLSV